jgi:hypothetical protein
VFCAHARCHAGHPPRCCRDEKAADGGPARFRKYSKSRAQSPRSLKLIGRASNGHRVRHLPDHVERAVSSFGLPVPQREPTLNAEGRGCARGPRFELISPERTRMWAPAFWVRHRRAAGPAGPGVLATIRASSVRPAESVPPTWSTRKENCWQRSGCAPFTGLAGSPAVPVLAPRTAIAKSSRQRLPKVPGNIWKMFQGQAPSPEAASDSFGRRGRDGA